MGPFARLAGHAAPAIGVAAAACVVLLCCTRLPADKPVNNAREPAVAGMFYPADKAALTAMVDKLLADAKGEPIPGLRAIVAPHAGYVYSGPTAACAYKAVPPGQFNKAILLAPSHYALVNSCAVPGVDAYRTPLGDVPIAPEAATLAKRPPFALDPKCTVQRPPWAARSPKKLQPPGQDTAETWEHAGEVQVPFLQRTLGKFTLIPAVCGDIDSATAAAAAAVAAVLTTDTLLVASSDLSHYHPYDKAKALDTRCVKAVCDLDIAAMERQEACGKVPILILMHLARTKGWKPRLLDYRNSGDTAGDKSGVVGYAAIAFYESEEGKMEDRHTGKGGEETRAAPADAGATTTGALTNEDGAILLRLARQSLEESVTTGRVPKVDVSTVPQSLREMKGCFVTLTEHDQLRGCIGHIFPRMPLCQGVVENARSAALHDSRFRRVQPDELADIHVEVSVLTMPEPLAFDGPDDLLAKLQPHRDGVVLDIGGRMSTFLPQVWEQLPDKVSFLNHLSQKSGCAASAWRGPGVSVKIYHAQAFEEPHK